MRYEGLCEGVPGTAVHCELAAQMRETRVLFDAKVQEVERDVAAAREAIENADRIISQTKQPGET